MTAKPAALALLLAAVVALTVLIAHAQPSAPPATPPAYDACSHPDYDANAGECPAAYRTHEAYAVAMGWKAAYEDGECNSDWWHEDHMSAELAEYLTKRCYELGLSSMTTGT